MNEGAEAGPEQDDLFFLCVRFGGTSGVTSGLEVVLSAMMLALLLRGHGG